MPQQQQQQLHQQQLHQQQQGWGGVDYSQQLQQQQLQQQQLHQQQQGWGGGDYAQEQQIQQQQYAQQQQQQQYAQQQQQQGSSWESSQLLEKSNKLSIDDHRNIQQFFAHREQQLPLGVPLGGDETTGIWKVKLNEGKTVDPTTGESVKETLYLELDYGTFGYKKTRKIKRK